MSGRRAKEGRRAVRYTIGAHLKSERSALERGWPRRDPRELGFETWDAYWIVNTSREWGRPKEKRWWSRWPERWARRRLRRELARRRAGQQ